MLYKCYTTGKKLLVQSMSVEPWFLYTATETTSHI